LADVEGEEIGRKQDVGIEAAELLAELLVCLTLSIRDKEQRKLEAPQRHKYLR